MGRKEANVDPVNKIITICEDIYIRASKKDDRSRFTIAHEIGHIHLFEKFGYADEEIKHKDIVDPYEDSEWQANEFAAELLMPHRKILKKFVQDIAIDHGVTLKAAHVRVQRLKNRKT